MGVLAHALGQAWATAHWDNVLVLLVTDTENERGGGNEKNKIKIRLLSLLVFAKGRNAFRPF